MKFKLVESIENKEKYEGWAQEDIDLFESVDWESQGEEDYDAGCAYLDSAVLYKDNADIERVETEFHKFFKNDPYQLPYYKPIEKYPFIELEYDYKGPFEKGEAYKDYPVHNLYNTI